MKSAADLECLRKSVQEKVRLRNEKNIWRVEIGMAASKDDVHNLLRELLHLRRKVSFPFRIIQNENPDERYRLPVLKIIRPDGDETIHEGICAEELDAVFHAMEKGD